ncbi:MAG: hypothetical protein ABI607_15400 [Betaproteobacteria bacterium]
MKLNILSDLHLSLGALAIPEDNADAAFLAGDNARPREAVVWASKFAKPVLYVPGNHEFYDGSIADTIDALKQPRAGTNALDTGWRHLCALDHRHRRNAPGASQRGCVARLVVAYPRYPT